MHWSRLIMKGGLKAFPSNHLMLVIWQRCQSVTVNKACGTRRSMRLVSLCLPRGAVQRRRRPAENAPERAVLRQLMQWSHEILKSLCSDTSRDATTCVVAKQQHLHHCCRRQQQQQQQQRRESAAPSWLRAAVDDIARACIQCFCFVRRIPI